MSKALYSIFTTQRYTDFVVSYGENEIKCHKLIYRANVTDLDSERVEVKESPSFEFKHLSDAIGYMYRPDLPLTNLHHDIGIVNACKALGEVAYLSEFMRKIFNHYPTRPHDINTYLQFCNENFSGDLAFSRCASVLNSHNPERSAYCGMEKLQRFKINSAYVPAIAKYISTSVGVKNLSLAGEMPEEQIIDFAQYFDYAEYNKIKDECKMPPSCLSEMYVPFQQTIDLISSGQYPEPTHVLYF